MAAGLTSSSGDCTMIDSADRAATSPSLAAASPDSPPPIDWRNEGSRSRSGNAAQHLGGQANAFPVAGTALERFYHHLFQSDREIVALAEEIGIGDRLLWLPSNVGYFADGKIWPLNGALDLFGWVSCPFQDRVRVGLVTAYLQRVKDWQRFESVTAASWLRRALGKRAYERTFGAQLRAKFGRYHDQVAMVWFWGKIWLRTTSRQLAAGEGASRLFPRQLQRPRLTLWPRPHAEQALTLVSRRRPDLAPAARRSALECRPRGRQRPGRRRRRDDAFTSPARGSCRTSRGVPCKAAGLEYEAAVVVLLQLSRPLSDIYWLNIADDELPFTGIIEHTNFMSPSDYDGKRFVYLSKYLEPDHPYFCDDRRRTDRHLYVPSCGASIPILSGPGSNGPGSFVSALRSRSFRCTTANASPIIAPGYRVSIWPTRRRSTRRTAARTTVYGLGNQIAAIVSSDLASQVLLTSSNAMSTPRPARLELVDVVSTYEEEGRRLKALDGLSSVRWRV